MSIRNKLRSKIIASIIFDRRFDIPDDLYKDMDEFVLINLIDRMNNIRYEVEYESNDNMKTFVKRVRQMYFDKENLYEKLILSETNSFWLLIFFNKQDWDIVIDSIDNDETEILIKYIKQSLCISDIEDTTKWLLEILKEFHNDNINDMITDLIYNGNLTTDDLVKISYMMKWNEDFNRTLILLGNKIPILYKDFCIETLFLYTQVVLESEYRGELDPNIDNQLYELHKALPNIIQNDDYEINILMSMIKEIGITLNHNNLKYSTTIFGSPNWTSTNLIEILENTKNEYKNSFNYRIKANGKLKNFKDIIRLIGSNPVGYPIAIQLYFITMGGDISTVFDENGKLLSEFSIVKFNDQLITLMNNLKFNQLEYLLYHSPEFIKNILVNINQLNVKNLLDIAKAFLTLPIDIKLWNSLNFKGDGEIDFRATIMSKIIDILSLEVLYNNVPETMAYIEPSILYIVKNIKNENIQFAPVHKIEPYLRPHMGKNPYTRYNLFVNGKYVSLQSAINDYKFLIDIIVKSGKFGYICDLDTNIDEVIDKVVDLIAIESEVNK